MFTWLLKKGTFTLLKNIGGTKAPLPPLFRRPWVYNGFRKSNFFFLKKQYSWNKGEDGQFHQKNALNESKQKVENLYVRESSLKILITWMRTKNWGKFQFLFKILSKNLSLDIMKRNYNAILNLFYLLSSSSFKYF